MSSSGMASHGVKLLATSIIATVILAIVLAKTTPLTWSGLTFITRFSPSELPRSMVDEPETGLNLLYDGKNSTVDLVFIHGLNGHSKRTWTSSNGVFWPQDLLPRDFPEFRIFSWGFDGRVASQHPISNQYLHDHSMDLAVELSLVRKETDTVRKPIIFLAHSLGGLIVKSVLIHCDSMRQGHLEHHKAIKLSTRSVYFFGTPHQGGNGVSLGSHLVNIAAVMMNTNSRLLNHLSRDSEQLQLLNEQFLPLSDDFEIKYFYETREMDLPGGARMIVVPKTSAVLPGTRNAEAIGIQENHRNMVRYSSQRAKAYQTVTGFLKGSVRDCSAFVADSWRSFDQYRATQERHSIYNITSNLPFHRNPYFVGREDSLDHLRGAFYDSTAQISHRKRRLAVLSGIGGIGKSQLAAEYAYRHREEYTSVMWIRCFDGDSISNDFKDIAENIERSLKHGEFINQFNSEFSSTGVKANRKRTADRSIKMVLYWLSQSQNNRWLLILDNHDNIEGIEIEQFIPAIDWGHVIVTSRRPETGRLGHHLPLDVLSPASSVALLLQSSHQSLSDGDMSNETRNAAERIARDLGYFPLALDQAGSFIHAQQIHIDEYLPKLSSNFKRISSRKPKANWPYKWTLFSAWELSFEAIRSKNPTAAKILTIFAIMGTDSLDVDMFKSLTDFEPSFQSSEYGNSTLEEIAEEAWSKLENGDLPDMTSAFEHFREKCESCNDNLDDTLELLFTYSFAKRRETRKLSIHPLVLRWAKERLSKAEKTRAARDAVLLIAEFNCVNMLPGKWITRPFSQHFYGLLALAVGLAKDYLLVGIPNSSDWALLLAVDRIATDCFYSRNSQIALVLFEALFNNPRMKRRAFGNVLVLHHYTPVNVFPPGHFSKPDWPHSEDVLSAPEYAELFWLWRSARDNATFSQVEAREFSSRFNKVQPDSSHGEFKVIEIVRNLTRLETYLNVPFRGQNEQEQRIGEAIIIGNVGAELLRQIPDFIKSTLPEWFEGRLSTIPPFLVANLNHPLLPRMLSILPKNFSPRGISYLAAGFKMDYLLSRYEMLLHTCFKAVISHDVKFGRVSESKLLLKEFIRLRDWLESVRLHYLTQDHYGFPLAKKTYLSMDSAFYSVQERMSKLEDDFAALIQLAETDPSPAVVELQTMLLKELTEINIQLIEDGEKECISRELPFFSDSTWFDETRINQMPGIDMSGGITFEVGWLGIKQITSGLCEPYEEQPYLLRKAFTPRQQAIFEKYLSSPWDKNTLLRGPPRKNRKGGSEQ